MFWLTLWGARCVHCGIDTILEISHYLIAGFTVFISVTAAGHAAILKRDSRAAAFWVVIILTVPLAGAIFYLLFGINRIRRRAESLLAGHERFFSTSMECRVESGGGIREHLGPGAAHLERLVHLVDGVVQHPLVGGNRIAPLVTGDQAFPAMLEAIRSAEKSVTLCTYIFDRTGVGDRFAAELREARRRGVEVRVLIDATGARYAWPSMVPKLRGAGINVARFIPTFPPVRPGAINLRNHRKVLVVDGKVGFTGGMNIRGGHEVSARPRRPVRDIHFRIEGPVVTQLQEVFADDWLFCTGERLSGEIWFPTLRKCGDVLARGIADGPDENLDRLKLTIEGAVTCAYSTIDVVTPYFLPDPSLVSALTLAALRGVEVNVYLPSKCNLPMVQWASEAMLWQVLQKGVRVWYTPPPFDHSKLMVVDGYWVLIGSANWDPRSLRLNFEFNLESYDRDFARKIGEIIADKRKEAAEVTLADVDGRSLPVKLRDGAARLFTPFL